MGIQAHDQTAVAGSPAALLRPGPSEPCVRVIPAHGSSKPRGLAGGWKCWTPSRDAVKIRCRRRRTSPSTRCQSIDSHARASPSGPFTPPQPGRPTCPSVPASPSPRPFTGSPDPRGRPFGGTPGPVSGQFPGGSRWEERPGASRSCRLSAHRHSLVGSSCARWGSAPPSRSAYRVTSDPIGVATLPAREIRPGWVPSILRGCGAHTAGTGTPAVAGRLTAAHPCTQVLLPPSPGLG
jgi:hypothetical protein